MTLQAGRRGAGSLGHMLLGRVGSGWTPGKGGAVGELIPGLTKGPQIPGSMGQGGEAAVGAYKYYIKNFYVCQKFLNTLCRHCTYPSHRLHKSLKDSNFIGYAALITAFSVDSFSIVKSKF